METSDNSSDKVELIESTIHQLLQSKQQQTSLVHHTDCDADVDVDVDVDVDKDTRLLTQLLSQVKSLKENGTVSLSSVELDQVTSDTADEAETKSTVENKPSGIDDDDEDSNQAEDVVKEVKRLEKQNRTTQWLVSVLIVVTIAWQVSEISLLLKLKEKLTNPMRSLRSMFAGVFKRPRSDDDKESST